MGYFPGFGMGSGGMMPLLKVRARKPAVGEFWSGNQEGAPERHF